MMRRLAVMLPVAVLMVGVCAAQTPATAPFAAPALPAQAEYPAAATVKITDKGAVPGGTELCTDAIEKAIEKAAAAGGGIVEFPDVPHDQYKPVDTVYLTGAIRMRSHITLQIDKGVTLKFSTDRSLYPVVKTRYECTDVMNYSPLIDAQGCENIRITGGGTLDGQGSAWWSWARGKPALQAITQYTNDRDGKIPLEQRVFGEKVQGLRPCFIEPYACKNVLIENVTLRESPFWNIHPVYSQDVTVRNVAVFGDGPNTDGCDPDSCERVLIEKCHFTTGDDCIAIKSGRDGDGIRRNAPCENITIRDCTMNGGHGAITMGSETSGGIRHVLAEDCTIDGPDSAVRLKSTRGRGGGIEDVEVRRLTVKKALKVAITVNMKYSNAPEAPKSETTPVFRNIRIEDFTCDAAPQAIELIGLPESPIEQVVLKHVAIHAEKGARAEYVSGLTRENVDLAPGSGNAWTESHVTGSR